jgi:hypothetical protein
LLSAVAVNTTRPLCGGSGKRHLHLALALGRRDLVCLQAVDALEDRFRGLRALGGLSPHDLGEHAQPVDLRLLPLGERCQALLLEHPRLLILRVSAAVLAHAPRVQVKHARDRGVQQDEVVAHHDHRASVVAQEVHEPRFGVAVEVVGRLVEQEEVGFREQHPCQLNAAALTT